jgi:hypothetical protein
MIALDLTLILPSGESITAAEVLEGFALLAKHEATFPLLSRDDKLKAAIALAFEAVDYEEAKE